MYDWEVLIYDFSSDSYRDTRYDGGGKLFTISDLRGTIRGILIYDLSPNIGIRGTRKI